MNADRAPHELLYLSRRSATLVLADLDAIAEVATINNAALGLTGALVFDGERFAQLLEGPAPIVAAMLERIRRDPRHEALQVLHQAPGPGPRRFPGQPFALLRQDVDPAGVLAPLAGLRGAAALRYWLGCVSAA